MLADFRLEAEIFFFAGFEFLEIGLVALVHHGGSLLKAVPNLFAQLFCHGARLAELLMQRLQLVESRNGVGHLGQFFGALAEARLDFEVFLEIVGAELMVEAQLVVILLRVELIVLPKFRGLLGRHEFQLVPFCLQLLCFFVALVGLFGRCGQLLEAFYNGELALEVLLLFLFCLGEGFGALLTQQVILFLESLFFRVGLGHEVLCCPAAGDESLAVGRRLLRLQAVVHHFEVFQFGAVHALAAFCQFLEFVDYLLLRGKYLSLGVFGVFSVFLGGSLLFGRSGGVGLFSGFYCGIVSRFFAKFFTENFGFRVLDFFHDVVENNVRD